MLRSKMSKLDFGFGPQPVLSTDRPAPSLVLWPRRHFWERKSQHVQYDTHKTAQRALPAADPPV